MKYRKLFFLIAIVSIVSLVGVLGIIIVNYPRSNHLDAKAQEFTVSVPEVTHQEPLIGFNKNKLTKLNTDSLKKNIETILGDASKDYSVIYENLESGAKVTINPDTIRPPASISKIPYAILVLREVDTGKITLDTTTTFKWNSYGYPSDDLYYRPINSTITFRELLEYLLQESDNTAMTLLEEYFGGVGAYNQTLSQLGIEVTRLPHESTAADVHSMMKGLYEQRWLTDESTEILYDLMEKTNPKFHDRIVSGIHQVDPTAKISHKIGQIINDDYGETYHDTAIIHSHSHYTITVLNEHVTPQNAINTISKISLEIAKYEKK